MNPHTKSASFLLVILLLYSVSVIGGGTQDVSLTVLSGPYTIEKHGEYHKIEMEGFFTRGIPGNPALPQKVYDIEVPYSAVLDTVGFEIMYRDADELTGLYEIGPAPQMASAYTTLKDGKNSSVYEKNAVYPETPIEILRTYQIKDKKIRESPVHSLPV
jgi:hypothetical protein